MRKARSERVRAARADRVAAHVADLAAELRRVAPDPHGDGGIRSTRSRRLRPSCSKIGFTRPRLLLTALLLTVVTVGGVSSLAAYNAQFDNTGNAIASGTVTVSDNDGGASMLSLTDAHPGATDVSCIEVTYDGTLTSTVRLYGNTIGTGLDQYLDLKITRGSYSPANPGYDSCTDFSADSTNYIGAGAGVIYNGTLQGFADSYAAGLIDPTAGSPESWTNGETHVYMFQVTLQNNSSAQGKTAGQSFVWEARNQ